MNLADHPTVLEHRSRAPRPALDTLDADELRELCLEAGAHDVGFVEIDRPTVDPDREQLREAMPGARALVSFVIRMNREPIRSPARSVANLEFHRAGDETNDVARRVVAALEGRGVRALNPAMGFPMEMDRFPGKIWVVSHKRIAEAAGLGVMGIHRNVIHPRFGNFILLGTIVVDTPISRYDHPIDYNPCLECKLCVAACPVGAIHPDGAFDFTACYSHNYREFMGGFTDWVETIADSGSAAGYRARVDSAESASMWQSLSFGANYKAAYCLAVCPAGEDVIGPFLDDRKGFRQEILKPLQEKEETIYVVPGSDAEAHVAKRFPHKEAKRIHNGLRVTSVRAFLDNLPVVFQPGRSEGLDAIFHFHFHFQGEHEIEATVVIRDRQVVVHEGLVGSADLEMRADARTWIDVLNGDRSVVAAILRRRIRVRGPIRLLRAFERCFPR